VKVTDRHNGLRMITASVLDSFHLQTPGYGHADEFLRLIKRAKLNFTELPTEILYTEYSRAKGQRLSNGIKILFDGMMSSK